MIIAKYDWYYRGATGVLARCDWYYQGVAGVTAKCDWLYSCAYLCGAIAMVTVVPV